MREERSLVPESSRTMRWLPVKAVVATLSLAVLLVSPATALAQGTKTPGPPKPDVKSWVLEDAQTGQYLAGKNPDEKLAMASTTKIMTALVVLNKVQNLDKEVTVTPHAASYATPPYSNVGLYPYDKVSYKELIEAALIPSGIDAAYALADDLGDGDSKRFVKMMNDQASSMGLKNTHFENPAGLDNKQQYTSARDLATMARAAMKYKVFADAVDTQKTSITTQDRKIPLLNTDELLGSYPPATGIKTGTTPKAGKVLVGSAKKGDESYISVVMHAKERYSATEDLLNYGFDTYSNRSLLDKGKVYKKVEIPYRRDKSVSLTAGKKIEGLVAEGSKIERKVKMPKLPAQASAGQKLGEVNVLVNGKSLGQSPLVASKGYKGASLTQKARYTVGGWVQGVGNWLGGLVK